MKSKVIYVISMIVYILTLTWAIIFKCNMIDSDMRFGVRSLNLIPFYGIIKGFSFNEFMIEIVLNILFFIPLGILLCLNKEDVSFKKVFIIALSISVTYELFQYIVGFGSTDITDVLMNTFGGVIGYFIYRRIHHKMSRERIDNILICLIIIGIIVVTIGTIKTINSFSEYLDFIK